MNHVCHVRSKPVPVGLTSVQSLSQADGELSGLPTPDSTPELPIKNMKALRHHQYEKNQNCNNGKDGKAGGSGASGSGSSLGFMAVVGNTLTPQAFPFSHHHGSGLSTGPAHGAGTSSSTSLHLLEERKVINEERVAAAGGGVGVGGGPHHHSSQQSLPQAVVDVSALDELLKHIHEVSASGTGGIKVLTSTSTSSLFPAASGGPHHHHHHHSQTRTHHYNHSHHHSNHHNNNSSGGGGGGASGSGHHHQQQIPEPESYFSTTTLPSDGLAKSSTSSSSSSSSSNNPTSSTSVPSSSSSSSSTPLQQQVIPERSTISVTRHHSQRQPLIKMGSSGGAVPRHHSFNQRGASSHAHFLARMNTNNSNGPPKGGSGQRPAIASTCLTRQHSYSEGPHAQRATVLRRTASLKPQIPPKPLFLPNTAASPVTETGNY